MQQETQTGDDGYPLYRRRQSEHGGYTATIQTRVDNQYQDIEVDNRWIVLPIPIL